MSALRLSKTAHWRFEARLWPRHRPILSETVFGPLRLVRVLSERDAQRAVERERARAFAAQQRAR